MAVNQPIKLVIVGHAGSGKTTFLKRLLTGVFEKNYEPTIGAEIHRLDVDTNRGKYSFDCFDIAPKKDIRDLQDLYYFGGQCAIIMFDATTPLSNKNMPALHMDLLRICGNIPIVLCGNKADAMFADVSPLSDIACKSREFLGLPFCKISVKSDCNLEKPFLYFVRKLSGNADIDSLCVRSRALAPPEVQVVLRQRQINKEHNQREDAAATSTRYRPCSTVGGESCSRD